MLKANFKKYRLKFILPAGTSRGVMQYRDTWFVSVFDTDFPEIVGVGEIAPLPGLSRELTKDFDSLIAQSCERINEISKKGNQQLIEFPSIRFGFETAIRDLKNGGQQKIFDTEFYKSQNSILINGLIWMGNTEFMLSQIEDKINRGYTHIKIKIGAMSFSDELKLLKKIRKKYKSDKLEIRVDANGAFAIDEALEKLKQLSEFDLHSIEQPIGARNWGEMAKLCSNSPIPIALDEELISINKYQDKSKLLQIIKPQYLIIKPSLTGGFKASDEWVELAEKHNVEWWATSALESNIGLNAISQWVSTKNISIPQGLGTGKLFSNNIPSPLQVVGNRVSYNTQQNWDLTSI